MSDDVTVNIETTLAALAAVSGVCPARSPKAVLMNCCFEFDPEQGSRILATDLEIGVRVRLIGARCDRKARVLLPPDRLKTILTLAGKKNTDVLFSIDHDAKVIKISASGCKYDLPLEDESHYPDVPAFDSQGYDEVDAGEILKLVKRTIPFCDETSTRFALGGVLLEFGDGKLTGVATDGRRLSLHAAPSTTAGAAPPKGETTVVPAKAMKLLSRLCAAGDDPVKVAAGPKAAFFRTASADLFTRLVDGRYPRYQDVFPADGSAPGRAKFTAETMLNAAKQAAVTTGDESRGVDCAFGSGKVVMTASAADRGASAIEAEIAYEGEPQTVTFDARYLVDSFSVVDPDSEVVMALGEKIAAVVTTTDGGIQALMPLTRDR